MKLEEAIKELSSQIHCPVCHGSHGFVMFGGSKFMGCPNVPENMLVPFNEDKDGNLRLAMKLDSGEGK